MQAKVISGNTQQNTVRATRPRRVSMQTEAAAPAATDADQVLAIPVTQLPEAFLKKMMRFQNAARTKSIDTRLLSADLKAP